MRTYRVFGYHTYVAKDMFWTDVTAESEEEALSMVKDKPICDTGYDTIRISESASKVHDHIAFEEHFPYAGRDGDGTLHVYSHKPVWSTEYKEWSTNIKHSEVSKYNGVPTLSCVYREVDVLPENCELLEHNNDD